MENNFQGHRIHVIYVIVCDYVQQFDEVSLNLPILELIIAMPLPNPKAH